MIVTYYQYSFFLAFIDCRLLFHNFRYVFSLHLFSYYFENLVDSMTSIIDAVKDSESALWILFYLTAYGNRRCKMVQSF